MVLKYVCLINNTNKKKGNFHYLTISYSVQFYLQYSNDLTFNFRPCTVSIDFIPLNYHGFCLFSSELLYY